MVSQSQKPETGSVLDTPSPTYLFSNVISELLHFHFFSFFNVLKIIEENTVIMLQNQTKHTEGKEMSSRCECKHSALCYRVPASGTSTASVGIRMAEAIKEEPREH